MGNVPSGLSLGMQEVVSLKLIITVGCHLISRYSCLLSLGNHEKPSQKGYLGAGAVRGAESIPVVHGNTHTSPMETLIHVPLLLGKDQG